MHDVLTVSDVSSRMIVCAAVLGQSVSRVHEEAMYICNTVHEFLRLQNNPLYLEPFQSKGKQEDALKFHYIVHCALDAVEEKGAANHQAWIVQCKASLLTACIAVQ